MLAAASTEARELEFFVDNRIGGDSNIFRRQKTGTPDEAASGFWEITPRLTLRDTQDELEYDFRYQPTFEQFFATDGDANENDVSGFDHAAFGDIVWRLTPDWTAGANGNFSRNRRLRQDFVDVAPGIDPPLESSDGERIQRIRGSAYVNHSLNARTALRGTYGYDSLDFNRSDLSDSESHSVSGSLNYALSPKTTIGTSVTGRFRDTRSTQVQVAPPSPSGLNEFRSFTTTADISFTLARRFNDRFSVSATAGPSIIRTEDDRSFGGTRTSQTDNSVFVVVNATYLWKQGRVVAGYTRSESGGGGGNAASSIVDDIRLDVRHTPNRDWTFAFSASWNHRTSVSSNSFFGNNTQVDRLSVSSTISRRVSARMQLIAQVRFSDTSRDQFQFGVNSNIGSQIATGFLSLRYTFEPFIF